MLSAHKGAVGEIAVRNMAWSRGASSPGGPARSAWSCLAFPISVCLR
jgi:hypothetical protein